MDYEKLISLVNIDIGIVLLDDKSDDSNSLLIFFSLSVFCYF